MPAEFLRFGCVVVGCARVRASRFSIGNSLELISAPLIAIRIFWSTAAYIPVYVRPYLFILPLDLCVRWSLAWNQHPPFHLLPPPTLLNIPSRWVLHLARCVPVSSSASQVVRQGERLRPRYVPFVNYGICWRCRLSLIGNWLWKHQAPSLNIHRV